MLQARQPCRADVSRVAAKLGKVDVQRFTQGCQQAGPHLVADTLQKFFAERMTCAAKVYAATNHDAAGVDRVN